MESIQNKITDGVINETKWGNDGFPKIVFFLKEAYSDESEFNLCKFLESEQCMEKTMWYTAAAWADLIRNPMDCENKDAVSLLNTLQHCAVVNVKKEIGNKTSDHKDLEKHFNLNTEELSEQLDPMKLDIIITGGTFKYLERLPQFKDQLIKESLEDNVGFYQISGKKSWVIRLRHPSYSEASTLRYFHILKKRYRERFDTIRNW